MGLNQIGIWYMRLFFTEIQETVRKYEENFKGSHGILKSEWREYYVIISSTSGSTCSLLFWKRRYETDPLTLVAAHTFPVVGEVGKRLEEMCWKTNREDIPFL